MTKSISEQKKPKMGRPLKYDPSMTAADKMRELRKRRLDAGCKPLQMVLWLSKEQADCLDRLGAESTGTPNFSIKHVKTILKGVTHLDQNGASDEEIRKWVGDLNRRLELAYDLAALPLVHGNLSCIDDMSGKLLSITNAVCVTVSTMIDLDIDPSKINETLDQIYSDLDNVMNRMVNQIGSLMEQRREAEPVAT